MACPLVGEENDYVLDHLRSVIASVDRGGTLTTTVYEPYGEVSQAGAAAVPWGFASGYLDDYGQLSMNKFGTRYYEPGGTMRWTQHDPERGTPSQPLSLNPYLYVGSNPVNFADPSGRQAWYEVLEITTEVLGYVYSCLEWGLVGATYGSYYPLIGTTAGFLLGCGFGLGLKAFTDFALE